MVIIGILRILFVLFVVRLLVQFVVSVVRGYLGPPARPRQGAVQLVRDRVCNTYVEQDRALTAVVNGHLEHFCSAACRDRSASLAASR